MKNLAKIAAHSMGALIAALHAKVASACDNPYKIVLSPDDVDLNWQALSTVAGKAILPAGYAVHTAYMRRGLEISLTRPPYETSFTNEYTLHVTLAPRPWAGRRHVTDIGETGLLLDRSIQKPAAGLFLSADVAPSSACHGIEIKYISDEMIRAGQTYWRRHGEKGLYRLSGGNPPPIRDMTGALTTWPLDSRTLQQCLSPALRHRVTAHRTLFPAGSVN